MTFRGVRERELRRKWRSVHGHLVRRLQHGGAGLVRLGKWRQGATWAERFAQEPAAPYVAVDGSSKVPELSSSACCCRWCCARTPIRPRRPPEVCDYIKHTAEALNKSDGWYDELLPNHTIVTAVRSVGCGSRG